MDLFEYQGKQLFAAAGIPIPNGMLARTPSEALQAAEAFEGESVLKAQVLIGGRGKAGGVRIVKGPEHARGIAVTILGREINGLPVSGVLVEEKIDVAAEHYLAILLDRGTRAPTILFSAIGGMDIEELAEKHPEQVIRQDIDPLTGLLPYQALSIAFRSGLREHAKGLSQLLLLAYDLFIRNDCTLLEINPLVRSSDNQFMALDAKVSVDDNSLYRHADMRALREELPVSDAELAAGKLGLHYVSLDGDVGIIGNGAGLVMATLDLVADAGGRPANFLDVGGGAKASQVEGGLKVVLSESSVRSVLVNIFGGITRCEEVAEGLKAALRDLGGELPVPVVVRLDGNGAAEGRRMLSGTPFEAVEAMEAAAGAVAGHALAAADAGTKANP